jgi:hypothetical protein
VVIAGDSAATFRGGGLPETTKLTCKVFSVGAAAFATSGLVKDAGRGFNAEAIVDRALKQRKSMRETMMEIRSELSAALITEFERLKKEEPLIYGRCLKKEDCSTFLSEALIATFEGHEPVVSVIVFQGQADLSGRIGLNVITTDCPGVGCPSGVKIFYLGQGSAIQRYIDEHGISMLPEKAAPFLVGLEIEAGTPSVGPPIDVLKITKDGVSWISRKSDCTGSP